MPARSSQTPLVCWLPLPTETDFTLYNLPFGIFQAEGQAPRVGVALGDWVIDMAAMAQLGYFQEVDILAFKVFSAPTLNEFIRGGKSAWDGVRRVLQSQFSDSDSELSKNPIHQQRILLKQSQVQMRLPLEIGDYTDFYSSEQHAYNVGCMFRDPANALLPNWKHLPVGYHGRASSIVVSGTPLRRPMGQIKPADAPKPLFSESRQLDFELEMAFVVGSDTPLGCRISAAEAEEHIFGFVLFNDWSARDIQAWEYVPLGPFLGKNFGSSVSPWVVPLAALEPFRVKGERQDPPVLPYLRVDGNKHFDINLEVFIQPEGGVETKVSRSNYKYLYWSINQQLAHHTVNGCNIRVGDLYASGTISGKSPDSYGSMLELAWKGTKPLTLVDGGQRSFIHDGDTVIMRGYAQKDHIRVGFGEVRTLILPALPF